MSGRFSGLTRSSGRIGLQLMDGPVEFRKLRARRLSAGSTSSGEESIRHFGYYVWDGPPELVSEIAPYTNVVIDVSWLRKGAGVIEAAQKAGRQVVPVVFGRERAGAEERLFPVIEKCRPAIPAVYWADTGEVGYSRDQVDGFGRVLKQRFPGIQLWVSYFNPSPNVPGFEIADAVDVVILSGLTGDSPQSVGSKIDAVLPAWKEKAGNRTIILAWLAHTGPPPGLVPKCARGTLRAWVEAARKHRLAGAIFASYGDCKERGTVGIRTRPELVDEVKRCSQELGVGPDAAPR
jgi:hypothetical protein